MSNLPSQEIREIWQEMKELGRLMDRQCCGGDLERREFLSTKFENVDILFGRESTLSKAIIFYEDQKMFEKKIKLSEIKRLNIAEGECLVIKNKPDFKDEVFEIAEQLGERLNVLVLVVDNFEDLRVISKDKLKK